MKTITGLFTRVFFDYQGVTTLLVGKLVVHSSIFTIMPDALLYSDFVDTSADLDVTSQNIYGSLQLMHKVYMISHIANDSN